MDLGNLEYAVIGIHGLIAAVFLANAVRVYGQTGEPAGLLVNLVLAAALVGLGVTIARIMDRRRTEG